jgi:ATP-dependent Lon protease
MTGEINLRGDVTAIGGVKEKILAAQRNKLDTVFLPEQNKNEFAKIKDIAQNINVVWVKHANEVLDKILMPNKNTKTKKLKR